jgi:hypothetical protein
MAAIASTQNTDIRDKLVFIWSGVTESDTYASEPIHGVSADVIASISGTMGGATTVLQGSNDVDAVNDAARTWTTVKDVDGTDISLTAAGSFIVRDVWPMMRFSSSSGSSQSITARLSVASLKR